MLIALEGPDGAGKSQLARALEAELYTRSNDSRRVTIDILHCGPLTEHPLLAYVVPLLHYRPSYKYHIIADRWHIGEMVYPKIMGRESLMDDAVLDHIETFLRVRGALLVHVTNDVNELIRRVEERGDSYIKSSQLPEIHKAFNRVMSHDTKLPVVTVRTGVEPTSEIVERILYHASIQTGRVIK